MCRFTDIIENISTNDNKEDNFLIFDLSIQFYLSADQYESSQQVNRF